MCVYMSMFVCALWHVWGGTCVCIFMNMCMDMFKIMEVFLLLTACNNILADKILRADFFFINLVIWKER